MTQPTDQQTAGQELPIGTRVRFSTLTGTVTDPDDPLCGQELRSYRPEAASVWVYLDPQWHTLLDGVEYSARGPRYGMWVRCDSPELTVLADTDLPDTWVGALVRLRGNPPEGHDRIGTVQRVSGPGWVVVAGQFTRGQDQAFPLSALERIQIVVLP